MPNTNTKSGTQRVASKVQAFSLGALAILSSFALGVQSAGEVQTVSRSSATGISVTGDMNGDQTVDARDVLIMLECAQGYDQPTAQQLLADPNNDGTLTVDDALTVLRGIAFR